MAATLAPTRDDSAVDEVLTPSDAPTPLARRMVSPDGHAAFALIAFKGEFGDALPAYTELRPKLADSLAKANDGGSQIELRVTGNVAFMHDLDRVLAHDLFIAEMVSLPLALIAESHLLAPRRGRRRGVHLRARG